jgi:hypothetical protein
MKLAIAAVLHGHGDALSLRISVETVETHRAP